jgi:hypothetical protein
MLSLKNKLNRSEQTALEPRVMLVKTRGFPVDNVPRNQSATISVNTNDSSDFNDRLLGLNFGWHVTQFRGTDTFTEGFDGEAAKRLIRSWAPPEIRWGDGVFGNFYDFRDDMRNVENDYDGVFRRALMSEVEYGFGAFARLQNELNFDTVFTFNVNYDSGQDAVDRLRHHRDGSRNRDGSVRRPGIDIDRIELGNELFFRNQRANRIRSRRQINPATGETEDLRTTLDREARRVPDVLRTHSRRLKAVDPSLQLSVPVSWRTRAAGGDDVDLAHDFYNRQLAADQSYYDAVSLHRYVRPGDSENGRRGVLDARRAYINTARIIRDQFPDKPIWLTEFAVDAGENAISALGLADSYLGFIDNPDLFESADYFQANSAGQPLLEFNASAPAGSRQFSKTTLGATYDTLREVFEGSDLLESSVNSTNITGSLDSVTAEVARKNGEILIYAVNKSPHDANFNLRFDGTAFNGRYEMRTFEFDSVEDFPDFRLNESAFKNPTTGNGSRATLPGLSISVISIDSSALRQGNGRRGPSRG